MIDPTPTTNEQIALKRGWTYNPEQPNKHQWQSPKTGWWVEEPPDFEHDWNHAGPLLEELVRETVKGPLDFFKRMKDIWNLYKSGMSLTEAIAHAWLVWKKEE